ncbi:MAG: hypothetical protein KAJ49_11225, partial [Arcobacteraceae bacterium]|nr:hypothetical protein [Arcobacteraceae bacterium]
MKNDNLKISNEIYNLDVSNIGDNLLHYSYHTRHLLSLIKNNIDRELPQYISAYNGFKGELYENVICELLLKYAIDNPYVKQYVLKGPHQPYYNKDNEKFGLLIDKSKQIVYKAGYKDVSEYDAMFFTEDSIYFVEMTIVTSTMGLRKRLRKKEALLALLFPNLKVKALIILSEGATGVHRFPEFATVWITKQLDANDILNKLAMGTKYKKEKLIEYDCEKLIHTNSIKINHFKYFDTLGWILRKSLSKDSKIVNEKFLLSDKISQYMSVFSKIYIGYITKEILLKLIDDKNCEINENSKKFDKDYIFVTIDKKDDGSYYVVFYGKEVRGRLKKIEISTKEIKVSDKDPKGFTVAETKFISHC